MRSANQTMMAVELGKAKTHFTRGSRASVASAHCSCCSKDGHRIPASGISRRAIYSASSLFDKILEDVAGGTA